MTSKMAVPLDGPSKGAEAWERSPLSSALADEARRLIDRLDAGQRLWLSGYLAGVGQAATGVRAPAIEPRPVSVTLLYGSQSGNAETVARTFFETLGRRGVSCELLDMMDCKKSDLLAAQTLLVIVSTQGEGDPPDRALALWELLGSRKAPRLDHVRYAVLGLGDSSYQQFCETGRQFDVRLEELGAARIHSRADCDVDFESTASLWIESLAGKLVIPANDSSRLASPARLTSPVSTAYTRKNPFHADVLVNQRLTAHGSTKDVRHIELSLAGSGIHYEPGDAIGIVPRNPEASVDLLLQAVPFSADSEVMPGPEPVSLRQGLLENFDIGSLNRMAIERYATGAGSKALLNQLSGASEEQLQELMPGWDLIDLVRNYPPVGLDAQSFTQLLRPLGPRLYSIASSLRQNPDEVHLTVSLVEYQSLGRQRRGVVSGMVALLDSESSNAPIYLHRNGGFRLPAADVPIIMIGPGTGVAPFRAFVAERAALGARGRNWLFFGDRCFETDFLYQADWLAWRRQGVLTRIEVAFSRDRAQKLYVQHRMQECGAELWSWLEAGAHIYVCGDAQRMAPDVHRALLQLIQHHGGRSEEQASEYLSQLQRTRRYQRDVY